MKTAKQFARLGSLVAQQRKIEQEIRKLREGCKNGYSYGFADGHVILYVGMPEYLALYPASVPTWSQWNDGEKIKGHHKFGPTSVGKAGDVMVWIEASTETVTVTETKVEAVAA